MPKYLKPHSEEWFSALTKIDPQQAAMTRQAIEMAGSSDGCSVCGDSPSQDYEIVGAKFDRDTVATIRLCDDCMTIRQQTQGEKYRLLADSSSNN